MLLGGIALFVLSLLLSEPITYARWTQITILAIVYKVVTVLVGWVLLDEMISVVTIIGFSVIVVGFVLVQYQTFTGVIAEVRHRSKSFAE